MRNQRIDLFKCLAIYCVVFLHIKSGVWDRAATALCRFAVPYFFLVSGYFSYGKTGRKLFQRAVHALLLWVIAFGLVLVLCAGMILRHPGWSVWEYISGQFTLKAVWTMLAFQSVPFPYAYHIWFMGALPVLYLIWWVITGLCRRAGRDVPCRALALVAVGLLGVHILLSEGLVVLGHEPLNAILLRNAWLDGLPFFMLGAWMHRDQEPIITVLGGNMICGGILAGFLLALIEQRIAGERDLFVGSALTALLLLAAALKWPEVKQNPASKALCACGNSMTFIIYAVHVPLYSFFYEWQSIGPFRWVVEHTAAAPFVISVLATGIAASLNWLKRSAKREPRVPAGKE